MSDFTGQIIDFTLQADPANRVSTIGNRVPITGLSCSLTTAFLAGSNDESVASSSAHVSESGQIQLMFGFNLFEKIIIVPNVKAVGFVLSSTQFPVQVWNTFHDAAKDLTAINVTGTGGITISNPFTLPKTIGAKGAVIFQAVVPGAGDVNIDLDVDFVFAGIAGTDLVVTGSRILVFSVRPDWDQGVEESIEFLTDVLIAYDDSEQRRSLRSLPRRGLKFRALTLEARDAAGMEALIWGWQHQPYGVPFWADAQQLQADIAEGTTILEVSTVDRLFAPGGILMIWDDEFIFEALTILAMDDDSITLSAPTQFAWKAGAGSLIVPLFLGRCSNNLEVSRLWSESDQIDIEFQGEALQIAPQPSETLTQFKGYDVLEIAPNWVDPLKRNYTRSTVTMDPGIGPITVDDKGGTPIVSHDLPWWISSHAKITAMRAFLFARAGRFAPFWQPTWDADLVLASPAASSSSVLNIKSMNYTRFFFPDPARRFLALLDRRGVANRYVQVNGSIDNGDGTESLTLASPLTADVPTDSTMISFLTFSRLTDDRASILWESTEFATAVLGIQELPREIPS